MPITVNLLPWNLRVSGGFGRVEVKADGEQVDVLKYVEAGVTPAKGWFAVYEDVVFGVFEWPASEDHSIALLIYDRIWRLTPETQLKSSQHFTHYTFNLNSGHDNVVFNYQRFWWTLFHRPKDAIPEVLFADDWWGVVCDLPGWVEARWNAGKLREEMAGGLKQRNGSLGLLPAK